jgi:hypothetical protein
MTLDLSKIPICISWKQGYLCPILPFLYSGTCLIRHTKGPGKCVGLNRMSEYSYFFLANRNTTDKLNHIMLYEYTSQWAGFKLTTLVVIGTECTGSCKSNYHTIMTMTAPDNDCPPVRTSRIWLPLNSLSSLLSKSFELYTPGQGPQK